jgi:hypothetical protein
MPRLFSSREGDPSTHWIGGWVGPRAALDMVVKRKIPSSFWDSNPWSSSPSCNTILYYTILYYTTELSWLIVMLLFMLYVSILA